MLTYIYIVPYVLLLSSVDFWHFFMIVLLSSFKQEKKGRKILKYYNKLILQKNDGMDIHLLTKLYIY